MAEKKKVLDGNTNEVKEVREPANRDGDTGKTHPSKAQLEAAKSDQTTKEDSE